MKFFAALLLAVLPLSLFAQNATIVLNYMSVTPGMESDYLEAEKSWKKFHEKRVDAGIMAGWQLWRNVYATADDPYQYIAIDWYNDWGHSLAGDPEGFWEEHIAELFTDEEASKIWEMTMKSRTLVQKEIMHRVITADNNKGAPYILVNRMKVKPGMDMAYMQSEREFSKPLQEEKIKQGQMSHWGVWQAWPYKEGQIRYSTVDGYESIEQMTGGGEDLLSVVHPDVTWEEAVKKWDSIRKQASIEYWELVDSVFPEAEE